jgi:type II secretory pathway component PulF
LERTTLKRILFQVAASLDEGKNLSESLDLYPKVFPDVYVQIIKIGEMTGNLAASLAQAAVFLETEERLHRKIKENLFYPGSFIIFSLLTLLSIIPFIQLKIMPVFVQILADYGTSVKWSHPFSFLTYGNYIISLDVFLIVAFPLCFFMRKTRVCRRFFTRLSPIGSIRDRAADLSFIRALAGLVESGIPLDSALERARRVFDGGRRIMATEEAVSLLRQGGTASETLEKTGVFSFSELWLLKSGEKSGNFVGTLKYIADAREAGLEIQIGAVSAIVQPVLILAGGFFVGVVVTQIYCILIKIANTIMTQI